MAVAGFNDIDLIEAFRDGRFPDAERLARTRVAFDPSDGGAWAMLGLSLREIGREDEVIPCFERAIAAGAEAAWVWTSYGTVLREVGRLDDARKAYLHALELDSGNAQAWVNLGYLFSELGFVLKAREALLKALHLDPDMPEVRVHAARMCLECGEDFDARVVLAHWRRWIDQVPNDLKVDLGSELIRIGENSAGQGVLHSLRADRNCGALAMVRLAAAQERLNDVEAARVTFAQVPPHSSEDDVDLRRERAMLSASILEREGRISGARESLQSIVELPGPRSTRVAVLFQLAKICDRMGDVQATLAVLEKAHAMQVEVARQLVPELLERGSVPLGIVDTKIDKKQLQTWQDDETAPSAKDSPIFVVGFPRSGTTMLEQMLDAHPQLRSMDEQAFVQRTIDRMEAYGLRYPEDLGKLDGGQCESLRQAYWSCVAKVVQFEPDQRLVDKNPLTMLRLPLLKRIFPHSKIIFVVRHPCDVLLSCYMQHFNAAAFTVLCSSIDRLARGYVRGMQFWLDQVDVLQPDVHEWIYETALEDFDVQVDRLGTFLEIVDTAPMREFSAHAQAKGYISTPSYAQVVKPLYKSSRGRWQKYRAFFEPVLPVLEPILRHWNYDA